MTARVRRDVLARGIGGDDQVVVVSLGLDLEPLVAAPARRGELRRELGLPADAPLVGIVARLVPVKAHEVFLQAAKAIAPVRPDIVFLIVGDGERRAELEATGRAPPASARASASSAGAPTSIASTPTSTSSSSPRRTRARRSR